MKTLLLMFLFAMPVCANDLPFKPQPQTVDLEFRVDTAALGTGWMLDTISTAQAQSHCNEGRCYEGGGLLNGYHSPASIMGTWAAIDVGAVVLSYEWKKHVHNRYLHPLWRVPLLIGTEQHTSAAIGNWRRF